MKPEHIVERNGRHFVLYAGLLNEAHEKGLKSIVTELIQIPNDVNMGTAICRATVTLKDETFFTGIGDAAPNNVSNFVANALIRMAETRSKARALRDAINVGMTALEELGEDSPADLGGAKGGSAPPRMAPMPEIGPQEGPGEGPRPGPAHWCAQHKTVYFKRGAMKGYAHPVLDTQGKELKTDDGKQIWCNEEEHPVSPELIRPEQTTPLAIKDAQTLMAMAKQVGYSPEQIHTWILGAAKKNNIPQDGETVDIIARFSAALMKTCRGQLQAKMPPEEVEEDDKDFPF